MQSEKVKMSGSRTRFYFVLATLVVQVLAIGWLIVRYERVVQCGTEVRFKCKAYDPYDPFRGRYLNMDVSETVDQLSPALATNSAPWRKIPDVFVRVEPTTNGLWRVAEASYEKTAEGVWLKPEKARFRHRLSWNDKRKDESYNDFDARREAAGCVLEVSFPHQLYVNEKLAPKAEELLNKKMADAVAVYRVLNGDVVLTDIEIAGKSIQREVRESLEHK